MAFAEGRPFGSRRAVGRAAFQAGSCSCKSVAVVEGGIEQTSWRAGIEAVVVGWRLGAALVEVASVVAGRSQGCTVAEGHRRVGREECFAEAVLAVVVCCAAAQERPWVA
jgi:hypothetical protein